MSQCLKEVTPFISGYFGSKPSSPSQDAPAEPEGDHPFITGFYGSKPNIKIQSGQNEIWSWDTSLGLDNVPEELKSCIQQGESATEV